MDKPGRHLQVVLRDLVDDVGRRLRETGKYAGVARLKLRWSDFQTLTRQRSFALPVCDDFTLRRMALELLDAEPLVQPVRLIGFGVSGLAAERQEQMSLFDDPADRRVRDEKLCHTIDSLREIVRLFSPEHMHWRYDPIVLSDLTPPEYHRARFAELAAAAPPSARRNDPPPIDAIPVSTPFS
jgi:hypothetical protein